MHKIYIPLSIITLLLISSLNLFGQEEEKLSTDSEKKLRFIGIETGYILYGSEFIGDDFVRKQDQYSYPYDINNTNSINNWYLGAKAELRSKDNNFGFLAGLRYLSLNSSVGNRNSDDNNDFFYFLFKEEQISVEYLRIQGINQTSSYIGIPLEVRYIIFNSKFARLFFKVATEINYHIDTKSNVMFLNDEMEIYEIDVINKFDSPNNFFSSLYFSAGIKLGKDDQINLNAEAIFLSTIISNNNSVINKPIVGGGFQINIQMPF